MQARIAAPLERGVIPPRKAHERQAANRHHFFLVRPASGAAGRAGSRRLHPLHPDPGADPAGGAAGRDVAGQAQTGTGKTLAFLVAVMNRLLTRPALADRKPEDPRALILAPTRELAIQIHKDAVKFGADLGLRSPWSTAAWTTTSSASCCSSGADVIIATPGRLIDYVKQHKVVSRCTPARCACWTKPTACSTWASSRTSASCCGACRAHHAPDPAVLATLSHRVLELAYEHMNEPEKLVVEPSSSPPPRCARSCTTRPTRKRCRC
jgi:hypothetical protein